MDTSLFGGISPGLIITLLVAAGLLAASLRLAQEYERYVVFRLGRVTGARGPGLFFLIPLIERATLVDTRTITSQLATQETVTKDGVAVKINAVLWFRAENPVRTVVEVLDWQGAVQQAAETAMRDTIGQNELDGLLKDRVRVNEVLLQSLSASVTKWGVQVVAVELKDLDIPENMQRAIAKEAEAVREKRARIIKAEGESEAAAKLAEAAQTMAANPMAMELRRLQTLTEIGAEHNSTIIISTPNGAGAEVAQVAAVARAVAQLPPGG